MLAHGVAELDVPDPPSPRDTSEANCFPCPLTPPSGNHSAIEPNHTETPGGRLVKFLKRSATHEFPVENCTLYTFLNRK